MKRLFKPSGASYAPALVRVYRDGSEPYKHLVTMAELTRAWDVFARTDRFGRVQRVPEVTLSLAEAVRLIALTCADDWPKPPAAKAVIPEDLGVTADAHYCPGRVPMRMGHRRSGLWPPEAREYYMVVTLGDEELLALLRNLRADLDRGGISLQGFEDAKAKLLRAAADKFSNGRPQVESMLSVANDGAPLRVGQTSSLPPPSSSSSSSSRGFVVFPSMVDIGEHAERLGQGSLLADAPWLVATVRGWGAPSGARCASAPSHRNDSSHRSDSSRRNGSSRQSDASFRGSFARAEASGRIVRVQHVVPVSVRRLGRGVGFGASRLPHWHSGPGPSREEENEDDHDVGGVSN